MWLIIYSAIGFLTFYGDRITKEWALINAVDGIKLNQFLSFDLVFNRGVTAGMFQSDDQTWFAALSFMIGAIIIALFLYTCYRWYYGHAVIGEVLTISGAISNVVDRYFFSGVVDFIHLTFFGYSFPIFNCADICIVLGVAIMFLGMLMDDAV